MTRLDGDRQETTISDRIKTQIKPKSTGAMEMARPKSIDGLIQTVRKDWRYYEGGKKERRYRVVFEYLLQNGEKADKPIKEIFKGWNEAKFRLNQLKIEYSQKGASFSHRGLLFEDYAEGYKRDKLADIDADTGKVIKLHIETGKTECSKVDVMIGFFKGRKLDSIRRDDVKRFKAYLYGLESEQTKRPLTPRTVHTYLQRLSALLNEAKADEKIVSVPDISGLIDRHLERKRLDKTITTAQLFELLAKCDEPIKGGRFKDRKHLKLPLIASHELGCRVGELREVKRSDILYIDHEEKCGVIRMRNNKASKLKGYDIFKDVPFGELLYDEMMANGVLDLAADAPALMRYPNYKTAWNWLRKEAGLGDIRWHDLRAVSATNRKLSGQDLETIQSQIGHEQGSSMTQDRYFRELVDTIKEHNDFMKWKRQQAVIQTESVS